MGAGGRHGGGSPLSPVSRLGRRRLSPGPPSLHRGRAQNRLPEVGSQAATEPRGSSFTLRQGRGLGARSQGPLGCTRRAWAPAPSHRTLSWGPAPRPHQGLSNARAQNGLECGTAPPAWLPGLLLGPPGGRARAVDGRVGWRQGQLEARATGPPTQHGQHAKPTPTLHTPLGHSQDDPLMQTPSKDRHWAPVSSTGTVHPAGWSHGRCPGEAGPEPHRQQAERPKAGGGARAGDPVRTAAVREAPLRVPAGGSTDTPSCLQKQTGSTQQVLELAGSQVGGGSPGPASTRGMPHVYTRGHASRAAVCAIYSLIKTQ